MRIQPPVVQLVTEATGSVLIMASAFPAPGSAMESLTVLIRMGRLLMRIQKPVRCIVSQTRSNV